MNALEIQNVKQAFRSGFWMKPIEILHGVSFSLEEGRVFGLLGPNGAGKTTLIHLIAGFRKPKGGSIRVLGQTPHTREARQAMGYLPERPYFPEHLSARQLLRYYGELCGMSAQKIEARTREVLDWVKMSHAADKELRLYSKGMLQRTGIAQAILHDPKFVILDEPMSGLDPAGRREMRELLRELNRQGRTVFFSTHLIEDIEELCTDYGVIHKGYLSARGTVDDVLQILKKRMEIVLEPSTRTNHARARLEAEAVIQVLPRGWVCAVESEERVESVLRVCLEEKIRVLRVEPAPIDLKDLIPDAQGGMQ
jgi:ABC-2 type transport system ATP-binding protein